MQSSTNNKTREETYMRKHSDIQISDTQGHTIYIVPNDRGLTENRKQTGSDQHMDKQDDSINT